MEMVEVISRWCGAIFLALVIFVKLGDWINGTAKEVTLIILVVISVSGSVIAEVARLKMRARSRKLNQ